MTYVRCGFAYGDYCGYAFVMEGICDALTLYQLSVVFEEQTRFHYLCVIHLPDVLGRALREGSTVKIEKWDEL